MNSSIIEHCRAETLEHILNVSANIHVLIHEMNKRALTHDASKLQEPELSGFAENTEKLGQTSYGTKEYQNLLDELQDTIKHHHSKNRHHPEHFKHGVNDMDLVDILEMMCDWIAACKRTKNGNIFQSLSHNADKFKIDDQLKSIIKNTINRYF